MNAVDNARVDSTQGSPSPSDVWRAFREIPDPEIPVISIVDLGVIRDVRVDGARVEVVFTPTFMGCPALETMRARMEDAIRDLEAKTAGRYAPGESVVFIGSSSIRLWPNLEQDMAPIPVIQHGFGGAKLDAVVHYADRLVSAYQPRAVVVFAGTNDIDPAASKAPEVLLASYQAFVARVRAKQPDVPIFYIAITPSPRRWSAQAARL